MPEVEQRTEQLPGAVAGGLAASESRRRAPAVSLSLDDALPETRAARRAFDRALDFESACFIHDEARARLLERLDLVRLDPARRRRPRLRDGARRGRPLRRAIPRRACSRIDSSRGMLRMAAAAAGEARPRSWQAATPALPLRAAAVELVLANLVLPWCRPERLFAEAARVLTDGGALLFATLGPDSLQEVRAAFAAVD